LHETVRICRSEAKKPAEAGFSVQRKQEVAHRSGLTGITALRTLADP
jgi:hypothetical protein